MYFVEKTKGINTLKKFDWFLFSLVALLNTVGVLALYSAVSNSKSGNIIITKQIIGIVIGLVFFFIISFIDYKDFKVLGFLAYIVTALLLIMVLHFGVGAKEVGTKGWLLIGPLSIQPSELGKVTLVLVASIYFERIAEHTGKYNIPLLTAAAAFPTALVFIQPDFGTALVYVFIVACMVFVAGISYKYIFAALGAFLASLPVFWFFILTEYQKKRFLSFFDENYDPGGANYQVALSKRAIGSGMLWGKGFMHGNAAYSVPEAKTDMIFSIIGEELGFIGSVVVVALIFTLILRCIYIAHSARDLYGSFLVVGLTAMYIFHYFENLGGCLGLLPLTGVPLPFISYGGTAIMTNYIALGVIMSVSIRRKRLLFD